MLTEQEAFDKEIELIKKYGRRDLDEGSLTNLTNGGEGMSGYIMPEKTKEKLRIIRSNQIPPIPKGSSFNRLYSEQKAEELKQNLRNFNLKNGIKPPSRKGKKHTEESKKKTREAMKARSV